MNRLDMNVNEAIQNEFITEYDTNGYLHKLINKNDPHAMNWVEGTKLWGMTISPDCIEVTRTHRINERKHLEETFIFTNRSGFPMYFKTTDLGIYATFNDNYQETSECMIRRCHAHLWCGNEASYVMALRMGGEGRNLGMALRRGSILNYSIERDLEKISNDRGDFIFHPELNQLNPGEAYELTWELFWFEDKEDFYAKLLELDDFPVIKSKQYTYFIGENIQFTIEGKGAIAPEKICLKLGGKKIAFDLIQKEASYVILVNLPVKEMKEYLIEANIGGVKTRASFWGSMPLEQLMKTRCDFIARCQQEMGQALDGAYLIYDDETKARFYSHRDDHNGGRERVAMGALMALYLQTNSDSKLEKSLERYISYIYRELYDRETGDVFNDIGRNHDWDRLYNYPWMAVFQLEVYHWKQEKGYLLDAYKSMKRYYEKGGFIFYAIGIPAVELVVELQKGGYDKEAEDIKSDFLAHADRIIEIGINYPPSEVNYEQSIVAPAVSMLLQAFELTQDMKYYKEAKKHRKILELFNGRQPDYHMYENAIRHWDGYWFGKKENYGDTFPHYWSVLSGVEYERYYRISKEEDYKEMAAASLRGCLNLYRKDGMASCAFVYPESVNGIKTNYYDPWANDQDWALYYAWKLRRVFS